LIDTNLQIQMGSSSSSDAYTVSALARRLCVVRHRPGLTRMMTAASRREFDVLVFLSLDQVNRTGALIVLNLFEQLQSYGVQYRSVADGAVSRLRWPIRRRLHFPAGLNSQTGAAKDQRANPRKPKYLSSSFTLSPLVCCEFRPQLDQQYCLCERSA
jgi:Resolvase, N terminal domain